MEDKSGAFDPSVKFVRLRGRRPNGFVEFDFAVGEPEISVEMLLEEEAFEDFCSINRVVFLVNRANGTSSEEPLFDWHPGDAVRRGTGKN